ncbi:MAG TPA: carboxymuconolactone decarboxylase family protein [Pseudonocardiaceae bacterium]|nr:carboxymuconolactone decarboxylase family protein [Pseudonocardiaceae bacterium]
MTDARIPPLPAAERTEDQQRLLDQGGSEMHIFTTLVRHTRLYDAFSRFAGRLLRRSGLPEQVRETLILRTAYLCRAEYEWVQHVRIATGIGMPATVIEAAGAERPAAPDEHTALLVRAADQLVRDHDLDDMTWSALREHYDDQQLIELCMLVGNYAMIAGVLKSLRVQLEDGQSAPNW